MVIRKLPRYQPDSILIPMIINGQVTPTDAGSGHFFQYFKLNSAYDPFGTMSNASPLGYDTLMSMYSRSIVHSCKIIIRVQLNAAEMGNVAVYPSNASSASSNFADAMTRPYVKYKALCTNVSTRQLTLTNYIKVKKLYGRPIASVNFEASLDTDPNNLQYWHLVGVANDGALSNLEFNITTIQYTQFFKTTSVNLN